MPLAELGSALRVGSLAKVRSTLARLEHFDLASELPDGWAIRGDLSHPSGRRRRRLPTWLASYERPGRPLGGPTERRHVVVRDRRHRRGGLNCPESPKPGR